MTKTITICHDCLTINKDSFSTMHEEVNEMIKNEDYKLGKCNSCGYKKPVTEFLEKDVPKYFAKKERFGKDPFLRFKSIFGDSLRRTKVRFETVNSVKETINKIIETKEKNYKDERWIFLVNKPSNYSEYIEKYPRSKYGETGICFAEIDYSLLGKHAHMFFVFPSKEHLQLAKRLPEISTRLICNQGDRIAVFTEKTL